MAAQRSWVLLASSSPVIREWEIAPHQSQSGKNVTNATLLQNSDENKCQSLPTIVCESQSSEKRWGMSVQRRRGGPDLGSNSSLYPAETHLS